MDFLWETAHPGNFPVDCGGRSHHRASLGWWTCLHVSRGMAGRQRGDAFCLCLAYPWALTRLFGRFWSGSPTLGNQADRCWSPQSSSGFCGPTKSWNEVGSAGRAGFGQLKTFTAQFVGGFPSLNVLINNAGILTGRQQTCLTPKRS
jgi:hypothetical protein